MIKIMLHISVAVMALLSTRSQEWKRSISPPPQYFIMKDFNHTEKLKELYSEHAYTHSPGCFQDLPLTLYHAHIILPPPINLYFLMHLNIS